MASGAGLPRQYGPARAAAAVALALALHGAALTVLHQPAARGAGGHERAGTPAVLLATLLAPVAPLPPVVPSRPRPLPIATMLHPQAEEAPKPALPLMHVGAVAGSSLPGLVLAPADVDYADWRRLSTLPSARGTVELPEQAMQERGLAGRATMSLFIDAGGKVVRVRVEASDLPPEIENSVQQAFYRAPFNPGLIGERAVPSRLRVEVVFETDLSGAEAPTLAVAGPPA